ncbi:MAG: aldehyde dehydrogenase family protein [Flavobacteriales bacterium]|jgi:acyl-CoA reductase-like NAD-dependent aldehyde dehydrogenase|nr:aldehyde dehydrogenase family protein [Flavobacteriales bacterium]
MSDRIGVLKTYKIFIDGKFPRTESGRFYQVFNKNIPIANMCLSSRKDIRNAVVAARKATGSWASKSANNRSQILYRIAENLESRKEQFIEEIIIQGKNKNAAKKEVELSIDRIIYFAGWCDKINQVFGAVNPVASSHFNFSMLEPMGVVGVVAPEKDSLLGVVSAIIPPLVAGNSTVLISSEELPLCSVTFAEVLATSDVPSGVVNILTGRSSELLGHLSTHMDVNAIFYCKNNSMEVKEIQIAAVDNLKRIVLLKNEDLSSSKNENPYLVTNFMETKTTWHPIEKISGAGSGY